MDSLKEFHDTFVKMIDFAKEHLTKEQFNEFIYAMYTYGIESVYIEEIPVYENVEYNGFVLWKRIKGVEYKITCKNESDKAFQKVFHTIEPRILENGIIYHKWK